MLKNELATEQSHLAKVAGSHETEECSPSTPLDDLNRQRPGRANDDEVALLDIVLGDGAGGPVDGLHGRVLRNGL